MAAPQNRIAPPLAPTPTPPLLPPSPSLNPPLLNIVSHMAPLLPLQNINESDSENEAEVVKKALRQIICLDYYVHHACGRGAACKYLHLDININNIYGHMNLQKSLFTPLPPNMPNKKYAFKRLTEPSLSEPSKKRKCECPNAKKLCERCILIEQFRQEYMTAAFYLEQKYYLHEKAVHEYNNLEKCIEVLKLMNPDKYYAIKACIKGVKTLKTQKEEK